MNDGSTESNKKVSVYLIYLFYSTWPKMLLYYRIILAVASLDHLAGLVLRVLL
jgi:hypothetical protein